MEVSEYKSKLTQRAKDNKQLKKKIKELTISRNEWKVKSISHKARADKLATNLKKVKDKLNGIISQ